MADYNLAKLGINIDDLETKSVIFKTILGEMSAASILFSQVLKTSTVGPDGLEEIIQNLKVIQKNSKGVNEEIKAVFQTVNGRTDLKNFTVSEVVSGGQQELFAAAKKANAKALEDRKKNEAAVQSLNLQRLAGVQRLANEEEAEKKRLQSAEDSLNKQRLAGMRQLENEQRKLTASIIASERKASEVRINEQIKTAGAMLKSLNKTKEEQEKRDAQLSANKGVRNIVKDLGGNKPEFTKDELLRLDTLKKSLQETAQSAGIGADRLDELFAKVSFGLDTSDLNTKEQNVALTIRKIIRHYDSLDDRIKKSNDKEIKKVNKDIKEKDIDRYVKTLGNPLNVRPENVEQTLKIESAQKQLQAAIARAGDDLSRRDINNIFQGLQDGTIKYSTLMATKNRGVISGLLKLVKAYDDVREAQEKAIKSSSKISETVATDIANKASRDLGTGDNPANQNQALKLERAKKALASTLTSSGITADEFRKIFDEIKTGVVDFSNITDAKTRNTAINLLNLKKVLQDIADTQNKPDSSKDKETFNQLAAGLNKNIQTKLGGLKSGFTSQDIAAIRSAQNSLANLVVTAGDGSKRFQQLFDAIRTGTVDSLGPLTIEERKAEVAMRRVIASFEDANNEGRKIEKVLITWRGLARILVVQQLHQVIGRVTNAIIDATVASNEFGKRIAEIQTISQSNQRTTEQWSASLAKLSNSFGTDLLKTTEAAYEAISNQIAHGAQVTTFMADALEFARVTSISAEQAVNLLSSSLNAYGKSSSAASSEAAAFFKIIDLGRIRAGDIANTFGNTAALASQMGVKLEEVGAALSTLTRQGIRPDTSMTLLNNVILKLLKPTEEMKGLLDRWGFSSGEAAVKTLGFVGVLRRLNAEIQSGGLSRAGELFSDLRAIRGIGGLGGDSFGNFESDLSKITNAQSEYNKASELTANTINFKLSKALNEVNTLLVSDAGKRAIEINYALIKSTGNLADNLKPVFDGFLNLYSGATTAGGGLLYLVNSTVQLTGGFSRLIPVATTVFLTYRSSALITYAFKSAVEALTAVQTAQTMSAYLSANATSKFGTSMFLAGVATRSLTTSVIAYTAALATNPVTWVAGAIAGITYLTTAYYDQQRKISEIRAQTIANLEEQDRALIKSQNERLAKETEDFKASLDERFKLFFQFGAQVQAAINATKSDFNKLDFKFGKDKFENDIFGQNAADTYAKTLERIKDLQDKAHNTKNIEDVKTLLTEATGVAENYNKELLKGIRDNDKEIEKLKEQRSDKKFDNTLAGLTDSGKISKYKSEIAKLKKEAEDLINADDIDKGLIKLERAFKLSEKLIGVTGTGKNAKRNKAGEAIQDDIEDARIKAREKLADSLNKKKIDAQQIEKDNEAHLEKLISNTKLLKEGWVKVQNAIKAAGEEMTKLGKEKEVKTDELQNIGRGIAGIAEQFNQANPGGNQKIRKQFEDFKNKSNELQQLTLNPLGKEAEIANLTQELRALANAVQGNLTGFFGGDTKIGAKGESVEKLIGQFNDFLLKITPLTSEIKDINTKRNEAENVKNTAPVQLEAFRRQADQLGIDLKTIEQPVAVFKGLAEQIAEGAADVVKGLDALGGLNPGGRASGGPLGFSSGGGIMRGALGRDNRLFRGHDGEFVVNAEAAAMFRPQLVAMNSNYQGMNTGGPITNVGDIHIHGDVGDSSQANVIALGKQMNRALRLGTIRLGRA